VLAFATMAVTVAVAGPACGTDRPPAPPGASRSVFERAPVGAPRSIRVDPKTVTMLRPRRLRYSTMGSGPVSSGSPATNPLVGPAAVVLPTFAKAFSWNGHRYPYRMVGTDPQGGGARTTVTSMLVPVSLRVAGQVVAPSTATISTVTGSGLFTARAFPGGTGQYGDVFMRTQFWSWLNEGSKNWHLTMAPPAVLPYLVLDVPTQHGQIRTVGGVRVAFVDVDWLDAQLAPTVVAADPNVLTQVLAGNVILCSPYTPAMDDCGVGGFHSAITDEYGAHTYTYQAYLHAALYGASTGFSDLGPMSHELAEWMSDPFLTNTVPPWSSPLAPQYGCLDVLESSDPVVGKFVRINGLAYQDEAYLPWFSRASSNSWLGRYTWFDSLRSPSPSCTL
jgi:hypothetical protein